MDQLTTWDNVFLRYGWLGAAIIFILFNLDKLLQAMAKFIPSLDGLLTRKHVLTERQDTILAWQEMVKAYQAELDEAKQERTKERAEAKEERLILQGRLLEIIATNERRDEQFVQALQTIVDTGRMINDKLDRALERQDNARSDQSR